MFGLFKGKKETQEEEEVKEKVNKEEIEGFLNAFMFNHNINPSTVILQDVDVTLTETGTYLVKVLVSFPTQLIGKEGANVKKIARGLSKLFDERIKVQIKY
jgi:ribosomal protein S3